MRYSSWRCQTPLKATRPHATPSEPDFLQTSRVGQQRKRSAVCLLDGGSQRTFVPERFPWRLYLDVSREEGQRFHLSRISSPIKRQARASEGAVLKPMHRCILDQRYVTLIRQLRTMVMKDIPLKDLDLAVVVATAKSCSTNVDSLIGADYCWQMVIEKARRKNLPRCCQRYLLIGLQSVIFMATLR